MGNATSISALPATAEANTSGRDHAAADAPPTAIISTPCSSHKDAIMNAICNTTLPVGDDGAALITLQPAPDPDKTPNTANKAQLASLLAPPAGYVSLTPEEREAAVEAGRLAREAAQRGMDLRMAAADAKARAAAQGGESFFGDMPGLGVGEELGGEEEDKEEDGGMQLEEEEEGNMMLDGINDATFGEMADWAPPAEDAIAAGRAAYVQEREQQAAAKALLNAQLAAFAAAQAQQH